MQEEVKKVVEQISEVVAERPPERLRKVTRTIPVERLRKCTRTIIHFKPNEYVSSFIHHPLPSRARVQRLDGEVPQQRLTL
jgi:hypothetical protein